MVYIAAIVTLMTSQVGAIFRIIKFSDFIQI